MFSKIKTQPSIKRFEGKIYLYQHKGHHLFISSKYCFFGFRADKLYFPEVIAAWRIKKLKPAAFTENSIHDIEWHFKVANA